MSEQEKEIEEYIVGITDEVREDFWKAVDQMVIPEMVNFMKNELSAKKIVETTMDISVALALRKMAANPGKLIRLAQLRK